MKIEMEMVVVMVMGWHGSGSQLQLGCFIACSRFLFHFRRISESGRPSWSLRQLLLYLCSYISLYCCSVLLMCCFYVADAAAAAAVA